MRGLGMGGGVEVARGILCWVGSYVGRWPRRRWWRRRAHGLGEGAEGGGMQAGMDATASVWGCSFARL